MSDRDLFIAALQIDDLAERAACLDQACAADLPLRQRVERLLRLHDEAGGFLDKPASPERPTVDQAPDQPAAAAVKDKAPSSAAGPGTRIGPYKLLQEIGEGGMGTVFMAEQLEPVRRKVALKVIKPGMDSKEVLARFEAERQALALMDHPNIAKVLDAGTTELGRPYFVMELVKGVPITRYCDEQLLSPRERLELFMPVCQAIQHAHQKGVIHRDIKPSNVMVTSYDGRPVPKVIDFGVAKAMGQQLTEKTLFTAFGGVVGTLEYMSPEQAELNALDIDTRSDIYGLGVLLYELLTGTTPLLRKRLKQAALNEALRMIREEEPPKPSTRLSTSESLPSLSAQRKTEPAKLTKMMRGELDWIVMKALEKDRSRRYETSNAFARDIERYLNDEPVEACPPSAGYRLRKLARKYRIHLRVAAALFLVLVAGVIVSAWLAVRATRAETVATLERDGANKARDAEQERAGELAAALRKTEAAEQAEKQRGTDLALALQKAERAEQAERMRAEELKKQRDYTKSALEESERNLTHGRILLAENAWNQSGSPDIANHYLWLIPPAYRKWEWGYLKRKYEGSLFTLYGHRGPVASVCFSGDGSRIASGSSNLQLTGGFGVFTGDFSDKTVRVWEAKSGQALLELKGHAKGVTSVSFSGDGSRIASGSEDNTVRIWDAESGKALLELIGHTAPVTSVSFSGDGSRIASGSRDNTVRVWDAKNGKVLLELKGHTDGVTSVSFSGDGSRIASGSGVEFRNPFDLQVVDDRSVRVWDAKTGQALLVLKGHTGGVAGVCFSGDGSRIASASWDTTVRVWDAKNGKALQELKGHTHGVGSVSFSGDGSRIASGSNDETVRVWDAKSGKSLLELKGHTNVVTSVSFSADGTRIASGSFDDTVRIWNAKSGQALLELKGHTREVRSVSFSADGSRIASGSYDETVRVWDAKSGQALLVLKGHSGGVNSACFSGDGSRIASASWDKTVRVWDAKNGKALQEMKGHTRPVTSVSFSADGSRIASGSYDETVRVWDAKSGLSLLVLKGHTDAVYSVTFNGDGSRIASASNDKSVRVWDANTGKPLLELKGHAFAVLTVVFSPDGTYLASGSHDQTVRMWDAESGLALLELKGHADPVSGLGFSGDGSRIASVSGSFGGLVNNTVRVWDAKNGQPFLELKGQGGRVTSVCFSRDGNRIASGSTDQIVRVWDATRGQAVLELKRDTSLVWTRSEDGSRIASSSDDKIVRLWDARTGQRLLELNGHTGEVTSMHFTRDGSRLATGSADKTVRVWDSKTGQPLLELKGHTGASAWVTFSDDGSRIASGFADKTVRVWDIAKGQSSLLELKGHTDLIWCVSFSPDGSRIASSSNDKTVRVWDSKGGQSLLVLKQDVAGLTWVDFSADGSRVFSSDFFNNGYVWDAKTGQRLTEPLVVPQAIDLRSTFPNGELVQIASGNWALIVSTQISEDERLRRLWLTRPDPEWHVQRAKEFAEEKNVNAAQLHRSWEQHARGVLAFEAGQVDLAYAHFLAAAVLKPKPPEAEK